MRPKIRVGVIPAAGAGRRIEGMVLSRLLPKPLLPVVSQPIVGYVIDNMKSFGVEHLYIIVHHKKELIQECLGDGQDFGISIDYVEQAELRGIAHALELTGQLINEPFVAILGDDFTLAPSLDNLARLFWETGSLAVEGVVVEPDVGALQRACCVEMASDGRIVNLIEKPTNPTSNLRGCGIYLFQPQVFDYISRTPPSPPRNEREITETLRLMALEGLVYGGLIDGVNININTTDDMMRATRLQLARASPGQPSGGHP